MFKFAMPLALYLALVFNLITQKTATIHPPYPCPMGAAFFDVGF